MIIDWIKNIIDKLLNKKKNVIMELPKVENNEVEDMREDFNIKLRKGADPEIDDRSGYKITKVLDLKDMI